MKKVLLLGSVLALVAIVYFFSYQLQKWLSKGLLAVSKKVGTFSVNREYAVQRYVYLHRGSLFAKFYDWVNEQLIAIGLKRSGVSPVGYLTFWAVVAVITAVVVWLFTGINVGFLFPIAVILFVVSLIMTRVIVSEKIEKREADIMDALDLIIPEIGSGVRNAIVKYVDNFAPSLQTDFKAFVSNLQDRGYSFPDAMFILSDSLGVIFRDFAQKAIFYEALGEADMISIFDDIVETNRLRRELRYNNEVAFTSLKTSFIVSSVIAAGYFLFLMATDAFSRYFFLTTTPGIILLICIVLVVFGVLSYITTIKSHTI